MMSSCRRNVVGQKYGIGPGRGRPSSVALPDGVVDAVAVVLVLVVLLPVSVAVGGEPWNSIAFMPNMLVRKDIGS